MYMQKVYHVHNYIIIYTSGTQRVKEKDAYYSCRLLGSDLFSNVNKLLLEYTSGIYKLHIQYSSDMQTLFDTCNVHVHAQGIPCT